MAMVLFAIVGVAFVLLLQMSRATAAGYEVQQLQQTKSDLEQRSHLLEAEMVSLQSLDRVEREAKTRLKMQPAQRYLFVTINEPSQEGFTTAPSEQPSPHPWWGDVLTMLGIVRH